MFNIKKVTVTLFALCCLAGCDIKEYDYPIRRSGTTYRALMYRTGTNLDLTSVYLELEEGSFAVSTGVNFQLTVKKGYVSLDELTQGRELFTDELIALYANTNHFPLVEADTAIEADTQVTDTPADYEIQLVIEDTDQSEDGVPSFPPLPDEPDTDVDESWETLAMINVRAPVGLTSKATLFIDLNNIPNDETREMLNYIDNLVAKYR